MTDLKETNPAFPWRFFLILGGLGLLVVAAGINDTGLAASFSTMVATGLSHIVWGCMAGMLALIAAKIVLLEAPEEWEKIYGDRVAFGLFGIVTLYVTFQPFPQ